MRPALALLLLALVPPASAAAEAPMTDALRAQLTTARPGDRLPVIVNAASDRAARRAVQRSGLRERHRFRGLRAVLATGTPSSIRRAARRPGVRLLEGDRPLRLGLSTSHLATRGSELFAPEATPAGPLDGRGVTIAVIDSGIDRAHPFFAEPDGGSAVVRHFKSSCLGAGSPDDCMIDLEAIDDSDTVSAGGHGTHVAGIAAGRPVTMPDGRRLMGAAPAAKLLSISIGGGLTYVNDVAALEWVLRHHAAPCGTPSPGCPPIRVINNSYGNCGEAEPEADAIYLKVHAELAQAGIVNVYAAMNCGGDGSQTESNPIAQTDLPGVIMVANYDDQGKGVRDGRLADSSSRGRRGVLRTYPDLAAPGELIESACRPWLPTCSGTRPSTGPGAADLGVFSSISGTSMATPHVAGIVAQLLQARPDLTPAAVEQALIQSATPISAGAPYEPDPRGGRTSFDKGHGLVDAVAALAAVTPPPAPAVVAAPATVAVPAAAPAARPFARRLRVPRGGLLRLRARAASPCTLTVGGRRRARLTRRWRPLRVRAARGSRVELSCQGRRFEVRRSGAGRTARGRSAVPRRR